MAGLSLEGPQTHRRSDQEGMNGVILGVDSGTL